MSKPTQEEIVEAIALLLDAAEHNEGVLAGIVGKAGGHYQGAFMIALGCIHEHKAFDAVTEAQARFMKTTEVVWKETMGAPEGADTYRDDPSLH